MSLSLSRNGWYHGWNIVAACILSTAIANGLTYNCYSLFLRDWSLELPFALALSASIPTNALISRWFVRRLGLALGLTAFGLGLAGVGAAGMGRAFGLSMLFVPIGALSPFVVAKTQETTGNYALALMGLAVLVIVAGVLSLLLRERSGLRSVQSS